MTAVLSPSAPVRLPVLPLAQVVVFPHVVVPLLASTPRTIEAVDRAVESHKKVLLGVVKLAAGSDQPPGVLDGVPVQMLHEVGTLGVVVRLLKLGDGNLRMLVQGVARVKLTDLADGPEGITAAFTAIEELVADPLRTEALRRQVTEKMLRVIELAPQLAAEMREVLEGITDPGKLADFCAANLSIDIGVKAQLLGLGDVTARLERLTGLLEKEIQVLEVGSQISEKLKSRLDEHQREYVLREQLKLIREELGDAEDGADEGDGLRKKLEDAKPPEEALKAGRRELARLARMSPQSAEYQVAQTYVELLASLPWSVRSDDTLDVARARTILDRDHYDLEKVKDRIVEYLAVRQLNPTARGSILCFVGPPGVGKTSLGQSIAEALGRTFVRMALGGVRDEAEIRGHRRTYVGALPGRILQGLKQAGTNNPVFMLDEVDKIGMDFRGDPSSALLEVLDPEQNFSFQDNYLEVPFDLRKVLFVATANLLEPIPAALRDRMEVIALPGYTQQEKVQIARRFLVPKQMENHGLKDKHVEITDEVLTELVQAYTHEAGVRNLERELASVMRKVARSVAEGRKRKTVVDLKKLEQYLGPPRYEYGELEAEDQTGSAIGLVVTEVGGDVVAIEVTLMEGKEDFILTGQLGDVMRESARAALSWIRSNAAQLGIEREVFEKHTLHIHVPAGATPKDGPSAGVTMATAMVSALTGIPVRKDVAMTGEITLRGRVLPIGGLKSKILAAHLAGAGMVILPRKNEKDLRDIPEEIRKQVKLVLADSMDQVLEAALRRTPKPLAAVPPTLVGGSREPAKPEPAARVRRTTFPPADQPPVVVESH